jgi:hypothetical protein
MHQATQSHSTMTDRHSDLLAFRIVANIELFAVI